MKFKNRFLVFIYYVSQLEASWFYLLSNFEENINFFAFFLDIFFKLSYNNKASVVYRGVAQLVERAVWDREVGGSRPSTPTTTLD